MRPGHIWFQSLAGEINPTVCAAPSTPFGGSCKQQRRYLANDRPSRVDGTHMADISTYPFKDACARLQRLAPAPHSARRVGDALGRFIDNGPRVAGTPVAAA